MRGAVVAVLASSLLWSAGFSLPPGTSETTPEPRGTVKSALHDSFDSVAGWRAMPADGVSLKIASDAGKIGRAMRLDFDFRGHGGYAIARRDLPVDLPEDFELTFWIKGVSPKNTLEVKLIDESGENVWWTTRRDYDFPRRWKRISIKKRQIEYAWGPLGPSPLPRRIAAIEIVVTAGTGGNGSVWIDELEFAPLQGNLDALPPPTGAWKSSGDPLTLQLGGRRELSGVVIDWEPKNYAVDYDVLLSPDGREWEVAREVRGSNGGRNFLYLPDSDAAALRLVPRKSSGNGYALRRLELKPAAWAKSPNEFFAAMASGSPRGDWPRYLFGEQSYWTIIGADGDPDEALMNEDGTIEIPGARISLEPFVWMNGRLVTWTDVRTTQSLARGYVPVPTVEWRATDLRLTVTAAVAPREAGALARTVSHRGNHELHPDTPDRDHAPSLTIRYSLEAPPDASFYVAVRPLQVNPPWQFLQKVGGVSQISRITLSDDEIRIVGEVPARIVPLTRPLQFGATSLDGGNIVEFLRRNTLPPAQSAEDRSGWASAAMRFAPGVVTVVVPMRDATPEEANIAKVVDHWAEQLNRVKIDVPDERITNSIRSNLAYIMINRDGPSIQPGSRSYDRSWIRDGSLTSAALLRMGQTEVVREFIEWYATHQYDDGKVPCCVGRAGADPVPENDSHGEFIYLIAEYYRFTRDRAFLERLWPRVEKTVGYIDKLRHERMTPEYRSDEKRVFYGLMPESISHEGYSAKPMHSYWDDLFALRGLKDAAFMANELGRADAARYASFRDEFRTDLRNSIRLSMQQHGVDYIPGAAELGDFDATSTTVYVNPGGEEDLLPDALKRTFDRYWENFLARRDGTMEWDGVYTPYEHRVVGTFVRLGEKKKAHEVLRFFFFDQRPPEWNHWSEAVHREIRKGTFIGDMPHTWVGSDFIRAAIDMLAYERESDQALVVGAGVPLEWIAPGKRVSVSGLRTWYGSLSYTMTAADGQVEVHIAAGLTVPPGGVVVISPIDGQEKRVRTLPADVRFTEERR